MNCQEILTILQAYRDQAIKVFGLDQDEIEVSSAYSFIIIEARDLKVQFEVDQKSPKIYELYPDNQSIRVKIESAQWPTFNSPSNKEILSEEIIKNLSLADSIAALAYNCTSGDDYRPGNFSKIILTENEIELQQINHMNAKSLDHKKDYSLRSLIFKIDRKNPKEKMSIEFRDNSSANNKSCGDAIQKAIDEHQSDAK